MESWESWVYTWVSTSPSVLSSAITSSCIRTYKCVNRINSLEEATLVQLGFPIKQNSYSTLWLFQITSVIGPIEVAMLLIPFAPSAIPVLLILLWGDQSLLPSTSLWPNNHRAWIRAALFLWDFTYLTIIMGWGWASAMSWASHWGPPPYPVIDAEMCPWFKLRQFESFP